MAKYSFDLYLLDVDERRLLRDNEEIRLRGKLFDTLRVLVENAGQLVRKDQLMRAVWPDSVVEENNLDHCISQLRKQLHPGKYIETVPRHGYRFMGDVNVVGEVKVPKPGPRLVTLDPVPQQAEMPDQEVRFFTTSDGVRIAYILAGSGPPIVRAIDWLSHLHFEWKSPFLRHWLSEIMRHNTLLRYDQRGSGLSDWDIKDFSYERTVQDFEELIEATGLEKFAIFGGCHGAAIATTYATRHPERVTRLILNGAFANGWPAPAAGSTEQLNALLTIIRHGWGHDNPAFRQMWSTMFRPDADSEQMDWMNELQRIGASPENAARMLSQFPSFKILDLLPGISCPTLVLHSRDDAAVSVQEGRLIASRIRGARFVELPSRSHLVAPGDVAWELFVEEFSTFMEWQEEDAAAMRSFA
jgi:DNA-binding winged helix-turn-helix (wHTH) protein/pimeloyl-ACP methyl ester carboxylesterase